MPLVYLIIVLIMASVLIWALAYQLELSTLWLMQQERKEETWFIIPNMA